MATGVPDILRPEDMARLANYRFAVRMVAEGWLRGRHRARGRGSSSDFLEYRAYSPGDDPRLVDWRVYARSDRLQLRTYGHEAHLECHLFVDSSASMAYRELSAISKLEYASHFAACVAWLVVHGHDRVSLQVFDEGIRHYVPPGSTVRHLNECLHLLEHNKPGGRTDLPEALLRSRHLLKRPGALLIISDFLCDTASLQAALNPYIHRGCKIVLVQVLDPGELSLAGHGMTRLVDMETGARVTCHLEGVQAAYAAAMKGRQEALRSMAAARGMLYLSARTNQSFYPLFDALAQ